MGEAPDSVNDSSMSISPRARLLVGIAVAIFNMGLQVSGYTNLPIAIALWTIAAVLVGWAAWDMRDLFRIRPAAPKKTTVSVPHEPYDQPLIWALHHIAASPNFSGMDLGDTPMDLRQAARNGTVTIYGRPKATICPLRVFASR
jgi:hypothetical protein